MNADQIVQRLKDPSLNRAEIQRATGLSYMYLSRLAWGKIKNPGSRQIDMLRDYFEGQGHEASGPR